MIMVTAQFTAKPGLEAQVREVATALVTPSKAEVGCLDIHLNEAPDKPGSFVFITRWQVESDFDRHLNTAYVKAFLEKTPTILIASPDVQRWNVIAPVKA
jgi:quinol monooxygenase YgiN